MASISRTGSSTLRNAKTPQRQCLFYKSNSRPFSSTSRRSAAAARRQDLSRIAPKQQSVSSRVKQMKKSEMPTDIGLVPGTFIRPTFKEGPSLFSSKWKQRLFIEWFALKQNFTDFAGLWYSYRWLQTHPETGRRLKLPLDLSDRLVVARSLHRDLYISIAYRDKLTIKDIACSGLAQQQSARIDNRVLNDLPREGWWCTYKGIRYHINLYWPLQFFVPIKGSKVVSDRQVALPFGENASLRQLVVRMKTKQTIDKGDGSARIEKHMVEYVVVQRMVLEGEMQRWRIWGTTKPSTYEDALEAAQPLDGKDTAVKASYWDWVKMSVYERLGTNADKLGKRMSS